MLDRRRVKGATKARNSLRGELNCFGNGCKNRLKPTREPHMCGSKQTVLRTVTNIKLNIVCTIQRNLMVIDTKILHHYAYRFQTLVYFY